MVVSTAAPRAEEPVQFPHYRHVDKMLPRPDSTALPGHIVLLADDDFAPYSFRIADGKVRGFAVDIALAACAQIKLACDVKPVPYDKLLEELAAKHGDAIIGGPPVTNASVNGLAATRAYFFTASQFVARNGANLADVSAKSLAGRRLGFVKATAQDAFLKKNFDRATLVPFDTEALMFDALRTGGLDLAFADSIHAEYWLKSDGAKGCCQALGAGFVDRATISHGLSMLVRGSDADLREALDYALDQAQESGATSRAFATYLPSSPF